jgi:hypothetical protein
MSYEATVLSDEDWSRYSGRLVILHDGTIIQDLGDQDDVSSAEMESALRGAPPGAFLYGVPIRDAVMRALNETN